MTDIVEWCNDELKLKDDHEVNDCTFHCNRIKGHGGNHMEIRNTKRYCMVWE